MQPGVLLEVQGLTRRFGRLVAVDGLDLDVREGEVLGFLGPNGAGKTTTLRMMCGLLGPDSGSIEFGGRPLRAGDPASMAAIGVSPQDIVVWDMLTCLEQLAFMGRMYGMSRRDAARRGRELLGSFGLAEKAGELGRTLSGGMKRRLNIALGLVHSPRLLFLDEPQAGLDPQSRVLVRDYLATLRGRTTVVITTHDMDVPREPQGLEDPDHRAYVRALLRLPHVRLLHGGHARVRPARPEPGRGRRRLFALLGAWHDARHPDGKPVFAVKEVDDLDAARDRVAARDADLLVEIPSGFSASLGRYGKGEATAPARVVNHGDEAGVRSSMAMALSDYFAFTFVAEYTLAVRALGRILTQGAGVGDVVFELVGMTILTAVYLALGTWLFRRRHMRAS